MIVSSTQDTKKRLQVLLFILQTFNLPNSELGSVCWYIDDLNCWQGQADPMTFPLGSTASSLSALLRYWPCNVYHWITLSWRCKKKVKKQLTWNKIGNNPGAVFQNKPGCHSNAATSSGLGSGGFLTKKANAFCQPLTQMVALNAMLRWCSHSPPSSGRSLPCRPSTPAHSWSPQTPLCPAGYRIARCRLQWQFHNEFSHIYGFCLIHITT